MREKTVKRFFCDYCSKGLFHRKSMVRHELSCYKNPERICSVCEDFGFKQVPMADLLKSDCVQSLTEMTPCPLCALSAVIQGRIEDDGDFFDYKEAMLELRKERAMSRYPEGPSLTSELFGHLVRDQGPEIWVDGLQP